MDYYLLNYHKQQVPTALGIHIQIAQNVAKQKHKIQQEQQQNDTLSNINQQEQQQQLQSSIPPPQQNDNITDYPICQFCTLHGLARTQYQYQKCNKMQSFLWTTVWDPTIQYMSEYYHFEVSCKYTQDSVQTFQNLMLNGKNQNHYIKWLSLHDNAGVNQNLCQQLNFYNMYYISHKNPLQKT